MTDHPVCYRCDDPLTDRHWVRLATAHRGAVAENYRDVDRRICPDCLAGIGLLEIDVESTTCEEGDTSTVRDRLPPIRTLRGGD